MKKALQVKCPQCEITFSYYESESRPFCSDRCKQIDLGHWFKESYVVPLKESVPEATIEIDDEEVGNGIDEGGDKDYEH
jgi:hypothetical protein